MKLLKLITLIVFGASLTACTTASRIADIGKAPRLTAIENPQAKAGYKPVSLPMPEPEKVAYQPNSLFISGKRGFFKDQRASKVGDILTVHVTIADKAQIANKTSRSRTSTNDAGAGGVVGSIFNSVVPDVSANAQSNSAPVLPIQAMALSTGQKHWIHQSLLWWCKFCRMATS